MPRPSPSVRSPPRLGAFLISALFGHPLLAPACAYAFWMIAGAAAGLAPPSRRPLAYRSLAAAAGVVILISTPIRAKAAVDDADLDHLGYGLSLWQPAGDGQRYRIATGPATIFIPSDAAVVKVPLRTSGGATRHPVSIRLRGRLVDRLPIDGHGVDLVQVQRARSTSGPASCRCSSSSKTHPASSCTSARWRW